MKLGWKKNTVLFLASQTMSLFGTMLVQYAIMWHIVLETQSGIMMTIYILVGVLPTFFTSLFGGVWADRYNKKHLINISDGSIAVASLAIAISLSVGIDSIILLMIAAAIRALGQGVQQPAVNSLIPLIVPEDKLLKINGINSSIQSGIFLLSPMAAASLMSLAPLQTLFFIDVVTASIAISILYFLVKVPQEKNTYSNRHTALDAVSPDINDDARRLRNKPAMTSGENNNTTVDEIAKNTSHFKELFDGLKYIKSQKFLLIFFTFYALLVISFSPLAVLMPLQVIRNFGPELWRLSAIEVTWAGGMILGGFLVGVWCFRNKIYAIGMSAIVIGMMTVLLGVWTNFIPYLICLVICGVASPYLMAPSMTLIQEKVATEYLGRTVSVFTMIQSIAMPIAMLFFGPLADIISIDFIMIGTGAMMVFLGILFFTNKTFKLNTV